MSTEMIINITQPAVKKIHLGYTTSINSNDPGSIIISAVEEVHYPHPHAPDTATIPVIEINQVGSFLKTGSIGSGGVVLEAINRVVSDLLASR